MSVSARAVPQPPINAQHPLILASTSRYRAELLARLRLPFEQIGPDCDEAEIDGEAPVARAARLAALKAASVAHRRPGRWVIGSDQVAYCDERVLHKPGSVEANIEQLRMLSGREAGFVTALTLCCDDQMLSATDHTIVRFRTLTHAQIARYVAAEPATDCAGGFKVEGLGISLFESVRSEDPTALIGLPLIALSGLLGRIGCHLP